MGSNTPSPSGNFSYPPPGSSLHFNNVDSLVTSWLSFDPNATDCFLSIWYWPNTNPWLEGYNQSARANGTAIVPLNLASNGYIGQLNINYTASDGTSQKFTGPLFKVDDSPQSRAVTWSQGVLASPTPSASASANPPRISISASLLTFSAPPTTITTFNKPTSAVSASAIPSSPSSSKPSSTSDARPGTGAIAGIVVGIVVCFGLAAALLLYLRRRKPNRTQAEIGVVSPPHFPSPVPENFIGEKDAFPLRPTELSGDGQLLEMAASYDRGINRSMGQT